MKQLKYIVTFMGIWLINYHQKVNFILQHSIVLTHLYVKMR
jgi:hypothetical protein